MKEIPLTQGRVTIVDDEDYEWLIQWKWHAQKGRHTFYAQRKITLSDGRQSSISMHRQILGLGFDDPRQGDHINHNGLDNRWANLRIVTQQENQWNPTDANGYCWDRHAHKYKAYISLNGKIRHLGLFDCPIEARSAHLMAKHKLHPGNPITDK